MDFPIIEFFEDEGFITKERYLASNEELAIKQAMLSQYKIDTALLIFTRNFEKIQEDRPGAFEEFYYFKNGSNTNICYIYNKSFIVALSPLGSANASGLMEELGFLGITKFFACGSAGQIDHNITSAGFILVDRAIRDEGVSYHYLKPSVYVETDKELTSFIATYLSENNFEFNISTTWTTDAFFRETPLAIEKRTSQGAVAVEMECAGWASVAKYRDYQFAQLLYFSDAVNQNWKWRPNKNELKNTIINLMIDCVEKFVKSNKKSTSS